MIIAVYIVFYAVFSHTEINVGAYWFAVITIVERPKALGDIRGVTYIYGMFYRFGLIDVPDEAKEKMKKAFSKSF